MTIGSLMLKVPFQGEIVTFTGREGVREGGRGREGEREREGEEGRGERGRERERRGEGG